MENLENRDVLGSKPRLEDESTDWQLRTLMTSRLLATTRVLMDSLHWLESDSTNGDLGSTGRSYSVAIKSCRAVIDVGGKVSHGCAPSMLKR